jgi:hypothetical protein
VVQDGGACLLDNIFGGFRIKTHFQFGKHKKTTIKPFFCGPGGWSLPVGQPVPGAPPVLQQGEPSQHALPVRGKFYFVEIFRGLECVGHSCAYVAHFVFLKDVWIPVLQIRDVYPESMI